MQKDPFAPYGFDLYKDKQGKSFFKLRPFGKKWPTDGDDTEPQCEEHMVAEDTAECQCEDIEDSQVID